MKRRVVQYYEKGERDGKSIDIPKTVRLACFALTQGTEDYDGPLETGGHKSKKRHKDKDKGKHKGGKGKKHGKTQKLEEELASAKPKDEVRKDAKASRRKPRK